MSDSENQGKSGQSQVLLILGLIFIGIIALSSILSSEKPKEAPPPLAAEQVQLTAEQVQVQALAQQKSLGLRWEKALFQDRLTGKDYSEISVRSTNLVEFDFPYQGPQRATISVRSKHPRFGTDVMLSIERGQFLCNSWDGCTISISFDGGKPEQFSMATPQDNSTTLLFFSNKKRIIDKLKKSKDVRVSASIYQQGEPIFEFIAEGLSPLL